MIAHVDPVEALRDALQHQPWRWEVFDQRDGYLSLQGSTGEHVGHPGLWIVTTVQRVVRQEGPRGYLAYAEYVGVASLWSRADETRDAKNTILVQLSAEIAEELFAAARKKCGESEKSS